MLELFAVGVAASLTAFVAKGLWPMVRAVSSDLRTGIKPVYARQVEYVSAEPLAESKAKYGEPDVMWSGYDYPAAVTRGLEFGPKTIVHPEGDNAIVWALFLVRGEPRAVLVRVRGGESYRPAFREQLTQEARDKATCSYQRVAIQTRAAVAEAAIAQREWLAALKADAERVCNELKAGRDAQLSRDWHGEAERTDATLRDQRLVLLKGVVGNLNEASGVFQKIQAQAERERAEALAEEVREVERAAAQARFVAQQELWAAEQARQAARLRRLDGRIPLAGVAGHVVFGTSVKTGEDFAIPFRHLQHMLICGVSGSGKSVLLHSLCTQFAEAGEVERLVLIDLKGGLEFERYADSGKVEVVWKFDQVCEVVEGLMQLMIERQDYMRANRQQNWVGGKIIVIIDEYAELQTEIDAAGDKDAKAKAKRFASSMVSLSRRARALGIVLVCALQKATTDSMDSSLRNNLGCRLVLRTANKLTASSMLELGDDLDSLSVSPTQLPTGRFYYSDPSRGILKQLQAQIAPGVQLDG